MCLDEATIQWNIACDSKIFDEYFSVEETDDGGYIAAGSIQTWWNNLPLKSGKRWERTVYHYERDALLVKVDGDGNELWRTTIGKRSDDCYACSMCRGIDGGFVCAGTHATGLRGDIWLFKVDDDGNYLWGKQYGLHTQEDWGTSVVPLSGDGYLVTGGSESYGTGGADAILIKTDSAGEREWKCVAGGEEDEWFTSAVKTTDGGYLATGLTESMGSGSTDIYLVKVDSGGRISWEKTFGGAGYDWPTAIVATPDGGYLIGGGTDSKGEGWADAWLIKVNGEGVRQWEKTYGGNAPDWATSIAVCPDDGYLVAGMTTSSGEGMADVWILRLNGEGALLWEKTFGEESGDWANSVIQTSDNGFVIAGETLSEKPWVKQTYRNYCTQVAENHWVIAQRTSVQNELYGRPLLIKLEVPEIEVASFDDGWDEDDTDAKIWTHRIPITLEERAGITRIDQPVALKIAEIFGHGFDGEEIAPGSLRVVDPDLPGDAQNEVGGNDVASMVEDVDGDGTLSSIDRLVFLTGVPATGTKTYYVYYSMDPLIKPAEYPELSFNLAMNQGFESGAGALADLWAPGENGYERVSDVAHTGSYSLCMEAGAETLVATAFQSHSITPPDSWEAVTISGWAKTEEMSGENNYLFSLESHLKYDPDNIPVDVEFLEFDTGTHDWQYVEMTLYPANPVKEIQSILVLKNHSGKVWFDDIEIRPLVYAISIGQKEENEMQPPLGMEEESSVVSEESGNTTGPEAGSSSEEEKLPFSRGIGALLFVLLSIILLSFVFLRKRWK